MLAPVLVALETARYKSLAADDMERAGEVPRRAPARHPRPAPALHGGTPLVRPREEKRDFGVESLQVGAILADVNARLKTNPALRAHPAVKNILMQVQRYNAENQKMRELLPTIKPEMRTSFLANFTRTFDEIIGSIRRQYAAILQEEAAADKARKEGFSLALLPLKELAPLLASQAREVSRFRSTLAHAREEKYKTREVPRAPVRRPAGRAEARRGRVKAYRRLCQRIQPDDMDAVPAAMATGFRDEVAAHPGEAGQAGRAGLGTARRAMRVSGAGVQSFSMPTRRRCPSR